MMESRWRSLNVDFVDFIFTSLYIDNYLFVRYLPENMSFQDERKLLPQKLY